MSLQFFIVMVTLEFTLLSVPGIAPKVAEYIHNKPVGVRKPVYLGAIFFVLFFIITVRLGISFTSVLANAITSELTYFSYGFLAHSLFRLKPKSIGNILGLIAFAPVVSGLLLGIVGIFGLMFIVGDFETDFESQLPNNLRCLISTTGNATATGSTEVSLYKPIVWEIERRVMKQNMPHNKIYTTTYKNECEKLAKAYDLMHSTNKQ